MKYITCAFMLLLYSSLFAQKKTGTIKVKGENVFLDSLIEKLKETNSIHKTIKGYRIQLFSGTERGNANEVKTRFLKLYPEFSAYLLYNQPYYKIRVGDFRTRLDAEVAYNKIKSVFDECIIVSDNIALPKL
jgi:hypothetical protein